MENFIDSIFNGSFTAGASFLAIGVLGLIVLVLAFILDGVFEALDFGDGPLSLTSISAFAAVFGFVGLISTSAGAPISVAALAGAITGLLGGAGAWWFSRFFKSSESSSSIDSSNIEGEIATVSLNIKPGRLGEVAISKHGIRHTFSAISDEEIPLGAKVKILTVLSASSVKVEKVVLGEAEINS